jgi:metal-responsive CopG/Arc/MetJ family transcriptional regulator
MKGACKKMRVRYVNISITEDLAKKIDEFMKKSKQGYRSRAEFISEAIRLRMGLLKESKSK